MGNTRPIPVVHLITTLDTGGTEATLLKLLSFMDRRRFSNQVVSLTELGTVGRKIVEQGIPVRSLKMTRGNVSISGLVELWKALRIMRPAILQTWLYHSDLLGLIVGTSAGIRNICWNVRCSYVDLDIHPPLTKWTIRMCSLLSRFPKVVVTNSLEAKRSHAQAGYNVRRWEIISNGFDLRRFKADEGAKPRLLAELGLSDGPKENPNRQMSKQIGDKKEGLILVGFVARYDPMKDHKTFIAAACLVLQKSQNVHFIMVGRKVDSTNKKLIAEIPSKWRKHFHLLGERDDVETLTASFDIASLASHGEGFPNVVCEAMASEVPCVVMDVGDSARIIGDTGLIVPPRDHHALARALNELIEIGAAGRHALGKAARGRVREYFELSGIVRRYESLYQGLLAGSIG
jgi:glycosyltransferase involved in cell wall biosynthesis